MAKKTTKAAKKSEAAASDVRVRLTDIFEYRLDGSSRRTLPKGWAGKVPAAIADKIEAEGKGGRDAGFDEDLTSAEATAATAKAAKAAKTTTAAKTEASAKTDAAGKTDGAAKTDAAGATAGSSSTETGDTDGRATETSTATQTDTAPAAGADTAASTDLLSGGGSSTD